MALIVEINTLLTLLIMYYFQLLHRKPLIILYLTTMICLQNSIFCCNVVDTLEAW